MAQTTNVVIGGASGIGAAVAAALAERGPLLVADRDEGGAAGVVRSLGSGATAVACDVTDDAQIASLVAQVDQLGALVVTAGGTRPTAQGRAVLSANLVGTAKVFHEFGALVGSGTVGIGIGSLVAHAASFTPEVHAVIDDPLQADLADRLAQLGVDVDDPSDAYNVSKRGIIRLASRLASTWGARGGRVLSVSPGVIDTPLTRDAPGGVEALRGASAAWPIPRLGRPQEIASVVAFLCSEAASYMTGCDVLVDGGLVASGIPFMPPRDAR